MLEPPLYTFKCMLVIVRVNDGCDDAGDSIDTNMFTSKQEELFQRRCFDLLIDADYVQWLKANHPESSLLDGHVAEASNGLAAC